MSKWWSVLFAVLMIAATGLFVVAPFVGWWLPQQLSTHAKGIDDLFYDILWITGFFFILTEALLCWFMWKYAGQDHKTAAATTPAAPHEPGAFAKFMAPVYALLSDQHKIEIAWTIVPSIILLYIAFAQVGAWAEVKYRSKMPPENAPGMMPVHVGVSARQWEWRMRYPSMAEWKAMMADPKEAERWAKGPQSDDVHVPNELHVIMNRPALIHLTTLDVLHSLFLPQMRVKQDSLPGKNIPVWFTPIAFNTEKVKNQKDEWVWQDGGGLYVTTGRPKDLTKVWDISCAELCGSRHGYMKGRVFVHEDEKDFLDWLDTTEKRQRSHGETAISSN